MVYKVEILALVGKQKLSQTSLKSLPLLPTTKSERAAVETQCEQFQFFRLLIGNYWLVSPDWAAVVGSLLAAASQLLNMNPILICRAIIKRSVSIPTVGS